MVHLDRIFDEFKMPLKFPVLKKLVIHFDVLWAYKIAHIDFTSCSETLESLELHYFREEIQKFGEVVCDGKRFLASFSKLRKLKTITYCNITYSWHSFEEIKQLKSLRLEIILLNS